MYLIIKLITIITEEEKIQEDKIEEEKVEIVEDNIVSAQNEEVEALADTDSLKAAIEDATVDLTIKIGVDFQIEDVYGLVIDKSNPYNIVIDCGNLNYSVDAGNMIQVIRNSACTITFKNFKINMNNKGNAFLLGIDAHNIIVEDSTILNANGGAINNKSHGKLVVRNVYFKDGLGSFGGLLVIMVKT